MYANAITKPFTLYANQKRKGDAKKFKEKGQHKEQKFLTGFTQGSKLKFWRLER